MKAVLALELAKNTKTHEDSDKAGKAWFGSIEELWLGIKDEFDEQEEIDRYSVR